MKTLFAAFLAVRLFSNSAFGQADSARSHRPHISHNNFYGEYRRPAVSNQSPPDTMWFQRLRYRPFNTIYAEYGGVTGWYSINYELVLKHKKFPYGFIASSIGFYKYKDLDKWKAYPFRVKLCLGYKRIFGEIGYSSPNLKMSYASWLHPGIYYGYTKIKLHFYTVGLRYQPLRRGVFVGIEAFPINFRNSGEKYDFMRHIGKGPHELADRGIYRRWWGGVSLGYSF